MVSWAGGDRWLHPRFRVCGTRGNCKRMELCWKNRTQKSVLRDRLADNTVFCYVAQQKQNTIATSTRVIAKLDTLRGNLNVTNTGKIRMF